MSNAARHRLLLIAAALILAACTAKDDPANDPAALAPAVDESATVEIRRAEMAPAAGLTAVSPRAEAQYVPGAVYVHDTVEFTEADFAEAALGQDTIGRPAVMLKMTDAAAERLETVTRAHIGKPLAITVHGELVAVPIVQSPLSSAMMITGLSDEEVRALIEELN